MHAPAPACYHAAVMKPRNLLRRLGRILPRALRLLLLRRYMARHHYPCADTWAPGESGEFSFTNASERTPLRLRGWVHRPDGQPKGTVFLLHGFLSCAAAKIKEARLFARECGLVCVAWDARAHGSSDAAVPTFGPQEVGDVSAALEKATAMGLPRPFILYGTSMGGMFAQMLRGFRRILINPSFHTSVHMSEKVGQRLPFHNPRKDGLKDFEVNDKLVKKYQKLESRQFDPKTGIIGKRPDDPSQVWAFFGTNDTTVNCKDEYLQHYTQAQDFEGEHRLDPDTTLNLIVPKILELLPAK